MLPSHVYSLIAKAHRYQHEPERFHLVAQRPLRVEVEGINGKHRVVLRDGRLQCDCDGFTTRSEGICAHVLGVEHHFAALLPHAAVRWSAPRAA